MTLASWTQQQIITQLDSGSHWTGPAVLYRFPTDSFGIYAPNSEDQRFTPLNAIQASMARLAFTTWGDLIAKPITEASQWANIDVANTTQGIEFAHAYFPTESSAWFNTTETTLQSPEIGQYGFEVFVHEFGHALGLSHMGEYNGAGDWSPSCFEDSSVYTVMSYFGPDHFSGEDAAAWGNWSADGITYSPQTPMLNDVIAIQSIYGANTATRSENTTYGFNTNITGNSSLIYDFIKNQHPILTLYDTGGKDTLDLSGWETDSTIDLNPGVLSSCNGMTNNLSIAFGTVIENLVTGAGNDTLHGNDANNALNGGLGNDILQGGLGNDSLDGGTGSDTAVYDFKIDAYTIAYDGDALHVNSNTATDAGSDNLRNIETLRFDDISCTFTHKSQTTVAGTYASYTATCLNDHFTLVKRDTNSATIDIYDATSRLYFSDLTAATDVGAGESTGEVYRLYLTVLGRNPKTDPIGCGFWVDKLDRAVLSTEQLVESFLNSIEFTTRFGGATSSNDAFVNLLYQNLLGRDGHADSGFAFWNSVLDNKAASRAQVVAGFMESPENVSNAATLIGDYATFKSWFDTY